MANPYPADVADSGGNVRLSGAITFTDPANQPGGGTLPSGAASPVGVVTPSGIGALYVETTHGTLYIATGATDVDWYVVGVVPPNIGEAIGLPHNGATQYVIGGVDRDTPLTGVSVVLTDAYAQWNGTGSSLTISGNGTDGQQSLRFANAAGESVLHDVSGASAPAGGVIFPAADPHITNAWWDNNGVLTRSSG